MPATMDKNIKTDNVEVMDDLLTTDELARCFHNSPVTINVWRREEGLPYVRIRGDNRDTIRFRRNKVKRWADKSGKTLDLALVDQILQRKPDDDDNDQS